MKTKKKTGILISLLLAFAFMLSGIGGIFFADSQKTYASATEASVELNVGDTFFFGKYPQTRVDPTVNLKQSINRLKYECGLTKAYFYNISLIYTTEAEKNAILETYPDKTPVKPEELTINDVSLDQFFNADGTCSLVSGQYTIVDAENQTVSLNMGSRKITYSAKTGYYTYDGK